MPSYSPQLPIAAVDARIDLRLPADVKALFEAAATIRGFSSTKDFLISIVEPVAKETVNSYTHMHLNAAASKAFVAALLDPVPPSRLADDIRHHSALFTKPS